MDDKAKFEGTKRDLVDAKRAQARRRGARTLGRHRRGRGKPQDAQPEREQFERFQELGRAINESLEAAVSANADPTGDEGERIYRLHRSGSDSPGTSTRPEAHRGLAEMYTSQMSASPPITMATSAGCAAWLAVDAISRSTRDSGPNSHRA
ncbi:MAG: TipAS antibiotic-recognition domain-containing protein [Collinsella sp.]